MKGNINIRGTDPKRLGILLKLPFNLEVTSPKALKHSLWCCDIQKNDIQPIDTRPNDTEPNDTEPNDTEQIATQKMPLKKCHSKMPLKNATQNATQKCH